MVGSVVLLGPPNVKPGPEPDDVGVGKEKEPVVDGRGGSSGWGFGANKKGEPVEVPELCPNPPKGLGSSGLLDPKGTDEAGALNANGFVAVDEGKEKELPPSVGLGSAGFG